MLKSLPLKTPSIFLVLSLLCTSVGINDHLGLCNLEKLRAFKQKALGKTSAVPGFLED